MTERGGSQSPDWVPFIWVPPRTVPERSKVGARLCTRHQPQYVEKLCDIRRIPIGWFAKWLWLVPLYGTQPRSGGRVKIWPVNFDDRLSGCLRGFDS